MLTSLPKPTPRAVVKGLLLSKVRALSSGGGPTDSASAMLEALGGGGGSPFGRSAAAAALRRSDVRGDQTPDLLGGAELRGVPHKDGGNDSVAEGDAAGRRGPVQEPCGAET